MPYIQGYKLVGLYPCFVYDRKEFYRMENLIVIYQALPFLLKGILTTLGLVLNALLLGFVLGVPLSVGQVYGPRWIKKLIGIYIWFFRGLKV